MTAAAILRRRLPGSIARFAGGAMFKPIAPGLLWHSGCRCPGCGHRQWHVGRITAECAVCAAALIIATQPEGEPTWPNA